MDIDWAALGLVSIVTVVAAAVVVGIVSLGLASLMVADNRVESGRSASAPRIAGFVCLAAGALVVLYGLYLIIPQFHSS